MFPINNTNKQTKPPNSLQQEQLNKQTFEQEFFANNDADQQEQMFFTSEQRQALAQNALSSTRINKEEKRLVKQDNNKVLNFVRVTCNVQNELPTMMVGKPYKINTTRGNKKPIVIYAELIWKDNTTNRIVPPFEKLPAFYIAVLESVTSLYVAKNKNKNITVLQIYHHMTGDNKKHLTSDIETAIRQAMNALNKTFISIKWNKQYIDKGVLLPSNPDNEIDDCYVKGFLLEFDEVRIRTANGSISDGYQIAKTPVLFEYADLIDQVNRRLPIGEKAKALKDLENPIQNIPIADDILRRDSILDSRKEKTKKKKDLYNYKRISFGKLFDKLFDTTSKEWKDLPSSTRCNRKKSVKKSVHQILQNLGLEHTFSLVEKTKSGGKVIKYTDIAKPANSKKSTNTKTAHALVG